MLQYSKIYSKAHPDVFIKVIPGHFVTPNAHINYYIDMTTMKSRLSEAQNCATALAQTYADSTVVDTIVCMDSTEVIGAFLAQDLTKAGVLSMNQHKTIYICTPEYDLAGQMIFRDNITMMVKNKNVLILLASTTTGTSVAKAIESIRYYGGKISGISAIFSVISKINGIPIHALFTKADIPDYANWKSDSCELCEKGVPITAIANGFGYSEL